MSDYIIIHKQSNLIEKVVCSSFEIKHTATHKAIKVSRAVLDKYYKLLTRKHGCMVDAGEMANISPAFKELLN